MIISFGPRTRRSEQKAEEFYVYKSLECLCAVEPEVPKHQHSWSYIRVYIESVRNCKVCTT